MNLHLINHSARTAIFLIFWTLGVTGSKDDFNSKNGKYIRKLSKSAEIKAFMDQSIKPCENFYNFACGRWHSSFPAQYHGNINTDRFQELIKSIERKLSTMLTRENSDTDKVVEKVKDFYTSCLEARTNSAKYRAALVKIYKEVGEFSAFKTEKQLRESNFEWWSTVAKILHTYGRSIILSLYILDDLKDKSKTMAYIGPPEFELTQGAVNMVEVIQEDSIRKYLQLYLRIGSEDAAIMAKNNIIFENNLAWGATDVRQGKSVEELLTLYNTTDLMEKYRDLFNVNEFLEIALGSKELPDQVYVYDESYLEGLYDIFNTTGNEHVEDYILWLFLKEYLIDITTSDMRSECTDKTKKYFGKFIDHIIYDQFRSEEFEDDIYKLWNDIKAIFRHNLESDKYDWISNDTRLEAVNKLNNMKLTINSYDNDNFVEFFKNLNISATNYVLNVQTLLEYVESLRENKLEKKTEDDARVLSFTPVYNILENQIKIPVALLQPHFIWDPVYPKAIQYGTLGYLIAHEMIHGFDDEGRNYDANGKAQNWWDEKSANNFESKRKCFEEQYHNYTYDGKRLPKSALQSENIADNGGLNIAYDAYVHWLSKHNKSETDFETDEMLPRLENVGVNNHQLFFISFAQIWCEDIHSLFRSTFANGDVHAPGMYRVIGALSNSRKFSWIFKCYEGKSAMDPPKKCIIY